MLQLEGVLPLAVFRLHLLSVRLRVLHAHERRVTLRCQSRCLLLLGRLRRDDIRHVATGLASGGVGRVRIDAYCWRFLLHCLGREPESSEELHNATLEVMVLHCEARSRPPARDREELLLWNS